MITYYKLKTQHLKIKRKKLSLLTNKSYKTFHIVKKLYFKMIIKIKCRAKPKVLIKQPKVFCGLFEINNLNRLQSLESKSPTQNLILTFEN